MSVNLVTTIIIGAVLAKSFQSAVGSAVSGIGQINQAAQALGGTLTQVGKAWASFKPLGTAVSQAGDLEHRLLQVGIAADMTDQQIAALKESLRDLAVPERTNQSVDSLLKGFNALVLAGMDENKAGAMLESMGRTSTATQTNMEDLAKIAFVLNDALGVAPEDMGKALDKLVFAGKQGAFQLKDMVKFFPEMGASAKELGLQGSEAVASLGAAFQIAKKDAADPAEAASNMKSFLTKAADPRTAAKFSEQNININQVLKDAMAKGENPLEAMLTQIQAMTQGDPVKLGKLFDDQKSLDFLKPMLADMAGYKRLKAEIAGSSGTVDKDFARMMETNKEILAGFNIQLGKLSGAVGAALVPPFNAILQILTPVVTVLGDLANSAPATTAVIIALGGAVQMLPPIIALATAAWRTMNVAMLASPIGLAVAAIAVGAALLIDNWGTVKSIGEAISGVFDTAWGHVTATWDAGVAKIMAIWERVRGPLAAFGKAMGWIAPDGNKAPEIGAAVAATNNAANDNMAPPGAALANAEAKGAAAAPGAGLAAAEAKGGATMTKIAAGGQSAAATVQRVEVVLILPPGVRAEMRGSTAAVSVIARTGQSMAGGN